MASQENDLATHDIALYIGPKIGPRTCQLRVLLISPSTVSKGKIESTFERIQHLVHITGGQDVIIAFLISPPVGARFASARSLVEPSEDRGTDGMLAYCKLQAETVSRPELSIPILPLSTLDGLPALLESHLSTAASPTRVPSPVATPFQMLQHCTTTPPLCQQTAFLLSDSFGSLRELVEGCCAVLDPAQELNSSSSFTEPSLRSNGGGDAREKLKRLKDLVGDQEWENLVVFWQQEWAME